MLLVGLSLYFICISYFLAFHNISYRYTEQSNEAYPKVWKMVTIKASHTVVPNQPTPKGRLWLSNSDQTARPAHTPNLYIYKAKHHIIEYDIEKMIDSLSIILVYYYPVAGRLSVTESGSGNGGNGCGWCRFCRRIFFFAHDDGLRRCWIWFRKGESDLIQDSRVDFLNLYCN